MLYLHRERVSKLTALHSALPDCINLYLCAFNLVKTGLVSSWSYAVVGKRGCLEDCSQAALAPWAVEGWLPSISSCLPPGQRWDVPLCDQPHSLSSPSALFHGSRCSLCSLWAESLKPSEKKKVIWLTLVLALLQRILVTSTGGGILCGMEAFGGGASNRESIWHVWPDRVRP